jgi:hypothetical protein
MLEKKAMIRYHAGKLIIKLLQIGMLIGLYITTTSATCQLLHSPEAHFVRLIIRILSTT